MPPCPQEPSATAPEIHDISAGADTGDAIEGSAADVPGNLPHLPDSVDGGHVWRHFGVGEQSAYVVLYADSNVVSEGYLDELELADLVSGLAG